MHSSNVVYAIHNFEAENEDEVTFQYGEPIVVLEKDDQYLDGWWQGRNTLGQTGLFPMNYTSPEMPIAINSRLLSYNNGIYHHSRMSSGTSSATSSSDEYRANSSEDNANMSTNDITFGISSSPTLDWSVEDVVTWLESVGLESVVDNFIDQEITGDVLINLDHDALKELGINAYGRRYKVMNAIKSLNFNTIISTKDPTIKRQSANSYLQSRYGSVTENLSNNKTNSISSLNSFVSSRSAVSTNLSIYRNSLSNHSTDNSGSNNNNDEHSSFSYSENGGNVLLNARPSLNSTCKRSTLNGQQSLSSLQRNNTADSLTLCEHESTASTATNCSTFPEYEGWIYKQSDRYKTWNKRWFVLHDTNLFYFKNPKDTKMKGIIHLRGYRVILEDSYNGLTSNKYHFKLHHDQERTFFFYTNTIDDMKNWAQELMKSTIQRDLCVPVVSSNTIDTVPLDIAQKMKPRPPSVLMYSNKDKKTLNYRQVVKNDVLSNTLEEELNETLLWMEHPNNQDDEPFQKLIIRSYPSLAEETQDGVNQITKREQGYFFVTPTKVEEEEDDDDEKLQQHQQYYQSQNDNYYQHTYEKSLSGACISSSGCGNKSAVLYWVNCCLAPIEIHDLSTAFRSGEILIQLLETLSGQSIARAETQISTSMNMLDRIVAAFKFMDREGVINNGCTIKDVFSGNEDKIVDMILSIKIWSEEDGLLQV